MAIFQWSSRFETGLDKVDAQHRRLVAMLNELDEARAIGGEAQVLLGLMDGLIDYTRYHFATEEALMADPDYPEAEAGRHRGEHQAFVDEVLAARAAAGTAPTAVSDELLGFLVHWLTEHMLRTDRAMGERLHARPADAPPEAVASEALIQALRESEERFRGLADAVPALIWMGDDQGRRVYANQQWALFTGRPREALVGEGWLDCVHPDDRARMAALHRGTWTDGEPLVAELRLRRADGRYRWFWESAVPRRRGDGTLAGLVGCAFDITERRQVEQLLRGAKQRLEAMVQERTRELEETNRALSERNRAQGQLLQELRETQAQLLQSEKMAGIGQLAAGVAHEINTPVGYVYANLGSLRGYLEGLFRLLDAYAALEGALPAGAPGRLTLERLKAELDLAALRQDLTDLVAESLEGARRARHIVQSLRDFSRIDHHHTAPFDLEAGLEASLDLAAHEILPRAEVAREYAGLAPVPCVGAEINQVFLNLLVNAAQAIDGRGRITVRTGRADARVWVEVEDTGRGIPDHLLPRIFEPFFTTRPVGQGTGLGLALCYGIVKQHRGTIEVHSREGRGTRFRVWLPAPAAPEET